MIMTSSSTSLFDSPDRGRLILVSPGEDASLARRLLLLWMGWLMRCNTLDEAQGCSLCEDEANVDVEERDSRPALRRILPTFL